MLRGSGLLRLGWVMLWPHGPGSERGPAAVTGSAGHAFPCFMGCDAPVATSTVYNQILRHGVFFQLSANRNKTVLGWQEKGSLRPSRQRSPRPAGLSVCRVSAQRRPHPHAPASWQVINPHKEPKRGAPRRAPESRRAGPSENGAF